MLNFMLEGISSRSSQWDCYNQIKEIKEIKETFQTNFGASSLQNEYLRKWFILHKNKQERCEMLRWIWYVLSWLWRIQSSLCALPPGNSEPYIQCYSKLHPSKALSVEVFCVTAWQLRATLSLSIYMWPP